jgi:hypothetical protein
LDKGFAGAAGWPDLGDSRMSLEAIPDKPVSPVNALAARLGVRWPNLTAASVCANRELDSLSRILRDQVSRDTNVVFHGSLARKEFTAGSDLDWTLLVDGECNPQHQSDLLNIAEILYEQGKPHGREKTFGRLTFSHTVLHMIGGEDDSNANTTRRILLLLEALPLGEDRQAFDRTRKNILRRYLTEDHGLFRKATLGHPRWIPLFLLNDMARYWRTMTVDFAYKQRDRGDKGYALRSIKLGISRKLIYASGLLACYWCDPGVSKDQYSEPIASEKIPILNKTLHEMFSLTPLERFAIFFQAYADDEFLRRVRAAEKLFEAYDEFLGLLHNTGMRKHLEGLTVGMMDDDADFQAARAVRTRFGEAMNLIFLNPDSPLYPHTISTGVF